MADEYEHSVEQFVYAVGQNKPFGNKSIETQYCTSTWQKAYKLQGDELWPKFHVSLLKRLWGHNESCSDLKERWSNNIELKVNTCNAELKKVESFYP